MVCLVKGRDYVAVNLDQRLVLSEEQVLVVDWQRMYAQLPPGLHDLFFRLAIHEDYGLGLGAVHQTPLGSDQTFDSLEWAGADTQMHPLHAPMFRSR